MIREEIVHINGIPKKLVVFLHGYLDCADDVNVRLEEFVNSLPDTAIHIPQAPFPCEVEPAKRQWFSMYRFDPQYDRRNAPTLREFVEYYNRMTPGLEETFGYLYPYLEQTLCEYGLDFADLFLCGFSQGAMVAVYTALKCPEPVGGVISFSGIVAGYEHLSKHALSCPDVLLLHGTADKYIRPQSMDFSAAQLQQIGCLTESVLIEGGEHQISSAAVKHALKFIANHR